MIEDVVVVIAVAAAAVCGRVSIIFRLCHLWHRRLRG